jgi:hypothetical protein
MLVAEEISLVVHFPGAQPVQFFRIHPRTFAIKPRCACKGPHRQLGIGIIDNELYLTAPVSKRSDAVAGRSYEAHRHALVGPELHQLLGTL